MITKIYNLHILTTKETEAELRAEMKRRSVKMSPLVHEAWELYKRKHRKEIGHGQGEGK